MRIQRISDLFGKTAGGIRLHLHRQKIAVIGQSTFFRMLLQFLRMNRFAGNQRFDQFQPQLLSVGQPADSAPPGLPTLRPVLFALVD